LPAYADTLATTTVLQVNAKDALTMGGTMHTTKSTPADDTPPLKLAYRPAEVARILGIGLTRTRQYIAEGRIKSARVGKCVLVTEEAMRAFLADAAVKGGV
jgi:excisionase family DNA binding protein